MSIESNQIQRCCICGEEFTGWGNNPWPVDKREDARCCNACNEIYVIPARLEEMYNNKR